MRETLLKSLLVPGLSLLVLAGCLDDDDGNGNNRDTGTFTDVGVENLSYETRSQSGTTDDEGRYSYQPGETISFSIGDLPIASDVPTAPFLTTLEITPEQREQLRNGGTDEDGLQTHRVVEETLAEENAVAINTMRLIMVLGEEVQNDPNSTIRITDRTIEQLNRYLAEEEPDINFDQPVESFASPPNPEYDNEGNLLDPSVVNRMLDSICFEPEDDELCEAPPTRQEINDTADEERKTELEQERRRILDARRTLNEVSPEDVKEFLLSETRSFRLDLEAPYFLEPGAVVLAPDETDIQRIRLRRTGSGDVELQGNGLDARAKGSALAVHNTNWQDAEVEYFHDGSDGDSGTILVNFKIDTPDFNNYRWFRKTLRVCINEDDRPCST